MYAVLASVIAVASVLIWIVYPLSRHEAVQPVTPVLLCGTALVMIYKYRRGRRAASRNRGAAAPR